MTSISLNPARARARGLRDILGHDLVGSSLPLVALVAMFAYVGYLNANAFSYLGLDLILSSAVALVFCAIAQSFIISLGDIDLGIGFHVGLANCVVAVVLTERPLLGVLMLVAMVAAYALQGLIIATRKVPSITFTLGASFVWLGVARLIAPTPKGSSPSWLRSIFAYDPLFLPLSTWLILVAAGLAYLVFFRSRIGLRIRAAGSNGDAYTANGSSLVRARVYAYALAAVFAILAGFAVTGVTGSADATASADFTLLSIAAVILGGASFSGGRMSAVGVVAGAVVLSLVGSVMAQLNVPSTLQTGATGTILLLAIAGRRFLSRRSG